MLQKMAVMALALGTVMTLQAQGPGGPGGPGPGGPRPGGPGGFGFGPRGVFGLDGPGPLGFVGPGFGGPVTNQPIADVESSTDTMKRKDGKTVTHTAEELKWRDAVGRERAEVTVPAEGQRPAMHRAEIFDPVKHQVVSLDFAKKIAVVRQLPPPRDGQRRQRPDAAGPRPPHTPPGVTMTTTNLPGKQIAGVYATGKEETRTVGVGVHGNTEPIVETSERYVSPDLKIVLYASENGPRGSALHQVTTLSRVDPDATLFEVPADFTVKNAPEHGRGGFRGPRGPGGPGGPPPAPGE